MLNSMGWAWVTTWLSFPTMAKLCVYDSDVCCSEEGVQGWGGGCQWAKYAGKRAMWLPRRCGRWVEGIPSFWAIVSSAREDSILNLGLTKFLTKNLKIFLFALKLLKLNFQALHKQNLDKFCKSIEDLIYIEDFGAGADCVISKQRLAAHEGWMAHCLECMTLCSQHQMVINQWFRKWLLGLHETMHCCQDSACERMVFGKNIGHIGEKSSCLPLTRCIFSLAMHLTACIVVLCLSIWHQLHRKCVSVFVEF